MKKILAILILMIGIKAYAVDYTIGASQATAPSVTMQSVNSSAYLSTGSDYSSNVYDVGQSAPARAGVRKVPPSSGGGGGASDYDPSNPQFSPIGDALIPLLLMVMAYATYLLLRRRKSRV